MFKYIKWELINEMKSKALLFGLIAVIYLLVLILPSSDSVIMTCIYMIFTIILLLTLLMAFIYGAKRTMDSYKNQTFLLESMIPLSPSKILLAKYILAIVFDFLFCLIFVLGFAVVFSKANINLLEAIVQYYFNADFDTKTVIARMFLLTISSTIAYTSLTSFIFIGLKSFFQNGKALKIISYVVSYIIFGLISTSLTKSYDSIANYDLIFSLIMIIITIICYGGSVLLIENKLEVYN